MSYFRVRGELFEIFWRVVWELFEILWSYVSVIWELFESSWRVIWEFRRVLWVIESSCGLIWALFENYVKICGESVYSIRFLQSVFNSWCFLFKTHLIGETPFRCLFSWESQETFDYYWGTSSKVPVTFQAQGIRAVVWCMWHGEETNLPKAKARKSPEPVVQESTASLNLGWKVVGLRQCGKFAENHGCLLNYWILLYSTFTFYRL